VRDECCGIDGFAVGLCVQGGVVVEVGFEAGWSGEGQIDGLDFWQRPDVQFSCCHCEVPLVEE